MKKSIARIATIFAAILAFAAAAGAGAQPAQAGQPAPYIRVSGEATAIVDADLAILSLGITQQAKTTLAAREAVTAAADKAIAAVAKLGVDRKDIRTSGFSITPVYDERAGKQNQIVGYRADASITVRLEDTGLVAEAIDAATGAGANEVRDLSYRKKNEDELRIETLKRAVANAAAKASAIAATLGGTLGPAISVEEQGYSMRAPDSRLFLAKAAAASVAASPREAFSPGSIEVSASVVAVFELR
jgi:uncharacterized protein YggE